MPLFTYRKLLLELAPFFELELWELLLRFVLPATEVLFPPELEFLLESFSPLLAFAGECSPEEEFEVFEEAVVAGAAEEGTSDGLLAPKRCPKCFLKCVG